MPSSFPAPGPDTPADPRIAPRVTDAVTVLEGSATAGLVLICDHASNALPAEYGTLGLAPPELQRHIAYDIGAAEVTRHLSGVLGVPAVLSHYSRLLIDLNRGMDDPTLVMRLSDGAIVPGNRHLDAAERERRIDRYYRPYHRAITDVVDQCVAAGVQPAIFSLHSFTDVWKGAKRPWHVGVLYDSDDRLAVSLLAALREEGDLVVGENQPYSGPLEGDSLWTHGLERGLKHVLVELRQDLVASHEGQLGWALRLERVIADLAGEWGLALPLPSRSRSAAAPPSGRQANALRKHAMSHDIDADTRTALEAAVYRRLVDHLRKRADVQNIDMMNLAGFCRNCLSNWYQDAAQEAGIELSKDTAREIVYGEPYDTWKSKHQKEASAQQLADFEVNRPKEHQ